MTIIEAKVEYCDGLERKKYSDNVRQIYQAYCFTPVVGNIAKFPRGIVDSSNAAMGSLGNPVRQPDLIGRDYLLNLMMMADQVCARELSILSANQRTVNAALSTTSTALSATASIVTGGLADNILSGGATLLGATRDHVNSEVFRGAQSEAITLLIQSDRAAIARRLLAPQSEGSDISVQEAIFFANEYHQACSLYNGLALLTKAAGEKADALNPPSSSSSSSSSPPPSTPTPTPAESGSGSGT